MTAAARALDDEDEVSDAASMPFSRKPRSWKAFWFKGLGLKVGVRWGGLNRKATISVKMQNIAVLGSHLIIVYT